jgi:hypothetical protein
MDHAGMADQAATSESEQFQLHRLAGRTQVAVGQGSNSATMV